MDSPRELRNGNYMLPGTHRREKEIGLDRGQISGIEAEEINSGFAAIGYIGSHVQLVGDETNLA
jgi:hypothetical protein